MNLNLKVNKKTEGIISGMSCSLFYGLFPILIAVLAFNKGSIKWPLNNNNYNIVIWGFVLVALKEFFNTITSILIALVRGKIKTYFSEISSLLKNRWGLLIIIGGIISGPFGYTFLTLGILFTTPAYGSTFSSWMPIFTMIGAVLVFKDHINWKGWIGVLLTIASAATIGTVAIINSDATSTNRNMLIIGIVLASIAPLCWSIENILIDIAVRNSTTKLNTSAIVNLKVLSGAIAAPIVIVIATLFTPVSISQAFNWYGEFFSNWKFLISIFFVGAIMFIGRIFFYNSVRVVGSGIASAFYNSLIISTALLQYIFAKLGLLKSLGGDSDYNLHWWFWLLITVMVIGIIMVTKFTKRNENDEKNIVWE